MFFANDQRDNVRAENPGVTFGMIPPLRSRSRARARAQGLSCRNLLTR